MYMQADTVLVGFTARWHFAPQWWVGTIALCRFVAVLVGDVSSWVRLLSLVSALIIDRMVIGAGGF